MSGIIGPIDVKQKGSASVGYWVYYVTLTLDLTYDLNLGFCNIIFWNSCISGIVGLINMKLKGSKLIRYWADYMTFPFDHTHDLDLEVSRSVFEISLSQEWNGWLTWNERDVSHPCMAMILTFLWPWWSGWMYQIVTGVTSDASMPSTFLVYWSVVTLINSVTITQLLIYLNQYPYNLVVTLHTNGMKQHSYHFSCGWHLPSGIKSKLN